MSQNLKMVPEKRDYLVENGSPVGTDRVEEASYFALTIPRNRWLWGVEGQGSFLYTLENQKRSASVEQQYASYAQEAIKSQVIDTGLADASQTSNFEATRFGTSNIIRVQPTEATQQDEFSFIPLS